MQQIFRQTWQLMKQNRLFSGVYIAGTALAIAMVMAYGIVWYVAVADIAPESNRSRSLYMGYLAEVSDEGGVSSSSMSLKCLEMLVPENLIGKEIEAVAVKSAWREEYKISSVLEPQGIAAEVGFASTEIGEVFDYTFLQGAFFSPEDVQTKAKKAVVTKRYARRLFGTADAVGQTFTWNRTEYTVCGVIADVSRLTDKSYANIWFPLSHSSGYAGDDFGQTGMLGEFSLIVMARSSADLNKVRTEINIRMQRFNQSLKGVKLANYGQPDTHFRSVFRRYSNSVPIVESYVSKALLIIVALLLIPAVNLAGVIVSGLDSRMEELGIRKAFGASCGVLLRQVLFENLLLTCMGGVLGLLLSYALVFLASARLMKMVHVAGDIPIDGTDFILTPQMVFNLPVFLFAFLVCLILNLLAGGVPTYLSLRKNIVESLTADKK